MLYCAHKREVTTMGAHNETRTYIGLTERQVTKQWRADRAEAEYEDGHGAYAGTIATMHGDPDFFDQRKSSQREAEEFCLDKHDKWSAPIACSFLVAAKPSTRDQNRMAKAEKKFTAAGNALDEAAGKIYNEFFAAKSQMVGCKGCGSRLNREKLRKICRVDLLCPLCRQSLLSPTAQKRITRLKEKKAAAQAAVTEARKPKPSKKIGWVVGGWAAC